MATRLLLLLAVAVAPGSAERPEMIAETKAAVHAHAPEIDELKYTTLADLGKDLSATTHLLKEQVQGGLSDKAESAVKVSEDYSHLLEDLSDGLKQYGASVDHFRVKERAAQKQHVVEVRNALTGGQGEVGLSETTAQSHDSTGAAEHEAEKERIKAATKKDFEDAEKAMIEGNMDELKRIGTETDKDVAGLTNIEMEDVSAELMGCFALMDDPAKAEGERKCTGQYAEKCTEGKALKDVCNEEETCNSKFVCKKDDKIISEEDSHYKVEQSADACTEGSSALEVCLPRTGPTKIPPKV